MPDATTEAPSTPSPSNLGEAVAASLAKSNAVIPDEPKAKPAEEAPKAKEPPAKEPEEKNEPEVLENPNLAPKKVEAPKAKEPAVEGEEPPKGMTKEAQQSFAEKRRELAAAKKQIDGFAAERESYETKIREAATSAPEITRLKSELEEAKKLIAAHEDEISISRIEATGQFKQLVAAPMAEVDSTVARLGDAYDLSPAAILDAIKEPDQAKRIDAIQDIMSDFKELDKDALKDAVKAYAAAQKVSEELRGNAKKKLEEITSNSTQEKEREFRDGFAAEWKALQEKHPTLRPAQGAQVWNDHLAKVEREAQAVDVNNISAETVAREIAKARALPEMIRVMEHYRKREQELSGKLESAEARLKEYVATEPGAGAGQNGSGGGGQVVESGTFGERVMSRARG